MSNSSSVEVILVGNAGSGKSWLGNVLAGQQVFRSGYAPTHVTTTHRRITTGQQLPNGARVNVNDTPGLEESHAPETFAAHREELKKAFATTTGSSSSKQLLLFVIDTNPGGRIKNSDTKLLKKITAAYQLQAHSILLVINMVRTSDVDAYEREVVASLPREIQYGGVFGVGYSSRASEDDFVRSDLARRLRDSLLLRLASLQPESYSLQQPLELESDAERAQRLEQEQQQRQAEAERLEREKARLAAEQQAAQQQAEAARRAAEAHAARQRREKVATAAALTAVAGPGGAILGKVFKLW